MFLLPVKCKSPRGDPHGPLRGGFALAAAGGHGVSCQVPWTSTFHWQQGRRSPKKIQSSKPRSHLNSLFHLFFPDKSKKLIRENWACPGNQSCKDDWYCGPDRCFNKQYWGEICLDTWYKVTLQRVIRSAIQPCRDQASDLWNSWPKCLSHLTWNLWNNNWFAEIIAKISGVLYEELTTSVKTELNLAFVACSLFQTSSGLWDGEEWQMELLICAVCATLNSVCDSVCDCVRSRSRTCDTVMCVVCVKRAD